MISIIIVHHQSEDRLRTCLRSIEKTSEGASVEVTVVDNATPRFAPLSGEFPDVRWELNGRNVGWGTAINQGAAMARGEILVFLNPDAELRPGALGAVERFFRENRWRVVGPVGGRLLFSDGRMQPSCGPFPHLAGMLWRMALPPYKRKNYLFPGKGPAVEVDWVSGAFMAVRRSVFERLGGFDPNFFLYYEDVDFCLRARGLGAPAVYLPGAEAIHHDPHALRKGRNPALEGIIRDSRLHYFKKNRPPWEAWALEKIS